MDLTLVILTALTALAALVALKFASDSARDGREAVRLAKETVEPAEESRQTAERDRHLRERLDAGARNQLEHALVGRKADLPWTTEILNDGVFDSGRMRAAQARAEVAAYLTDWDSPEGSSLPRE